MNELEVDLTYVLNEVQNLNSELETYFGKNGIMLARFEGIEARLKELQDALLDYLEYAPGEPFHAAGKARRRISLSTPK